MSNLILNGKVTLPPTVAYVPGTDEPVATFAMALPPRAPQDPRCVSTRMEIKVRGEDALSAQRLLAVGTQILVVGEIDSKIQPGASRGDMTTLTWILASHVGIDVRDKRASQQMALSPEEHLAVAAGSHSDPATT
ncbi:single-stranded DNA-binding protein [Longispora sp. NPDC051575]|uniref:single-stranded DNA-binding protein n=1 Tax=Longispora sp. NPDC051575 TaxID=3154943 RepID=UPI00343288CE